MDAEARQSLRAQAHDAGPRVPSDHRGQQSVVRRDEEMLPGAHHDDVARGPYSGVHYRDVHSSRRKVPEGPGQPEPGLGGPMDHDLVREVDDPRRRHAAEDAALHDTDERALMP